jgi:hypothetical protein
MSRHSHERTAQRGSDATDKVPRLATYGMFYKLQLIEHRMSQNHGI